MTQQIPIIYESPEIFAIFPILKRDRNRNYSLSLALEKSLYKHINHFNDQINKVFLFKIVEQTCAPDHVVIFIRFIT